ncbi:hypothetical protein [Streptomyces sp. 8K308]|uniref:hypothetical protein n=1 Tax=Streptomyces sp. 8K308 TaxID=2530388 RepID=UPI001404A3C7|nr:hypothetical protein [Streptomyces sp. 8K308]
MHDSPDSNDTNGLRTDVYQNDPQPDTPQVGYLDSAVDLTLLQILLTDADEV